jgi:WD40 repeat protein
LLFDAQLDDIASGAACFLPDRQEVAIAGKDGSLRVFRWTDPQPRRAVASIPREDGSTWCLRRHGNRLAVGRFYREVYHQIIRDFDLDTGELKDSWRAPGSLVGMDFSSDGRYCVMGSYRGEVLTRNMVTGEESSFVDNMPNIGSVAISPFGNRVGISCEQGFVRLWETGSWRDAGTLGGFLHAVAGVAFIRDGKRFAAGSSGDEAIRLYETDHHQPLITLGAEGGGFFPAFDSSGNNLAGMNAAGKLYVWRAPSWAEIDAAEKPRR